MNYGVDERAGRLKLTVLLLLNLALEALRRLSGLSWAYITPAMLAAVLLPLLPLAVILWSLYRASWPGFAVFSITVFYQIGDVMDLFQFGGVDALNRSTALSLVTLLLRLTTLLGIWRMDQVARYWQARMRQRKRSGLIWEIGLFAAAILAQFLPMLVLNLILRIE